MKQKELATLVGQTSLKSLGRVGEIGTAGSPPNNVVIQFIPFGLQIGNDVDEFVC